MADLDQESWTYLNRTLEMSDGEKRARFDNEMSEKEKEEFVRALCECYVEHGLTKTDLLSTLPNARGYVKDRPESLRLA